MQLELLNLKMKLLNVNSKTSDDMFQMTQEDSISVAPTVNLLDNLKED